jgi:hypothetical protein
MYILNAQYYNDGTTGGFWVYCDRVTGQQLIQLIDEFSIYSPPVSNWFPVNFQSGEVNMNILDAFPTEPFVFTTTGKLKMLVKFTSELDDIEKCSSTRIVYADQNTGATVPINLPFVANRVQVISTIQSNTDDDTFYILRSSLCPNDDTALTQDNYLRVTTYNSQASIPCKFQSGNVKFELINAITGVPVPGVYVNVCLRFSKIE